MEMDYDTVALLFRAIPIRDGVSLIPGLRDIRYGSYFTRAVWQEAERRTDGCSRSEDAQMVLSDRKWTLALQWEQNAGEFEAIRAVTENHGALLQHSLSQFIRASTVLLGMCIAFAMSQPPARLLMMRV